MCDCVQDFAVVRLGPESYCVDFCRRCEVFEHGEDLPGSFVRVPAVKLEAIGEKIDDRRPDAPVVANLHRPFQGGHGVSGSSGPDGIDKGTCGGFGLGCCSNEGSAAEFVELVAAEKDDVKILVGSKASDGILKLVSDAGEYPAHTAGAVHEITELAFVGGASEEPGVGW